MLCKIIKRPAGGIPLGANWCGGKNGNTCKWKRRKKLETAKSAKEKLAKSALGQPMKQCFKKNGLNFL